MSRAPKSFDELWKELDDIPDDHTGEIIDGEIVSMARPNHPHVWTSSDLGALLSGWFRFGIQGPGGWLIMVEPGIRFGDNYLAPDLAGWRKERFVGPPTGPYLVPPDWICEALSPGSARTDRKRKLPIYARHGVGHVWLVDAVLQTLEVYRRQGNDWLLVGTFAPGDKIRAEPFDAVELDVSLIFGGTREPDVR